MKTKVVLYGLVAAAAVAVTFFAFKPSGTNTLNQGLNASTNTPLTNVDEPAAQPTSKTVVASEVKNVDGPFAFSSEIPASWEAEAITAIDAINLFDPAAAGENNLERSQIFIRSFTAADFLTLTTVTIHSRETLTLNGRPTVRYDIEKKQGVANFPNQPAWRSGRHVVTDVRVSDASPSVFYVIAKRPDLDQTIYDRFLDRLSVTGNANTGARMIEPVEGFRTRITLKPFGIFISPGTSPVQPERFTGYHTGADAEFTDTPGDVPVRAVAPGTVVTARTASGYGGVLVIRHRIRDDDVLAVYGHLDVDTLPSVGTVVKAGETIGALGEGNTTETDFGRKHLHFALLRGDQVDLRGYVATEAELSNWYDPVAFLEQQ